MDAHKAEKVRVLAQAAAERVRRYRDMAWIAVAVLTVAVGIWLVFRIG